MTVTGGVGETPRPFVCCQAHVSITDYQDRVESGEAEMAPTNRITGDDQQTVIATGAQPGNRDHCVTPETVGNEPLSLAGRVEITTDLSSELTLDHERCRARLSDLAAV